MTLRSKLLAVRTGVDRLPYDDGWKLPIDGILSDIDAAISELETSRRETYQDGRHMMQQGDFLLVLDPYVHPDA